MAEVSGWVIPEDIRIYKKEDGSPAATVYESPDVRFAVISVDTREVVMSTYVHDYFILADKKNPKRLFSAHPLECLADPIQHPFFFSSDDKFLLVKIHIGASPKLSRPSRDDFNYPILIMNLETNQFTFHRMPGNIYDSIEQTSPTTFRLINLDTVLGPTAKLETIDISHAEWFPQISQDRFHPAYWDAWPNQ